MTALHETYLEKLSAESGLAYARLTDLENLSLALKNAKLATEKIVQDRYSRATGIAGIADDKPRLSAQAI